MTEKRIEQRGLWFEEFETDVVYVHAPSRTVTETDNVLFTTLTMNTQSLHLDAEWSSTTEFGERLVNSMFTLSTLVGLSVAQLTQGTIVANLGFESVTFPAPLRHGDTITSHWNVRPSRRNARSTPTCAIPTSDVAPTLMRVPPSRLWATAGSAVNSAPAATTSASGIRRRVMT